MTGEFLVPPLVRQGQLVEQIARQILDAVDVPFAALAYNATYLTGYGESELLITHQGGAVERDFPPRTISALTRELRGVMYTSSAGAWFSMTLSITAAGSASATFNFTDPPPLDGEVSPRIYRDDLAKYPRPASAIPDWLRDQLTGTGAP